MNDAEVIGIIAQATEFGQIKVERVTVVSGFTGLL